MRSVIAWRSASSWNASAVLIGLPSLRALRVGPPSSYNIQYILNLSKRPALAGNAFVDQGFSVGREGGKLGLEGGAQQQRFLLLRIQVLRNGSLLLGRRDRGEIRADPDVAQVELGTLNGRAQHDCLHGPHEVVQKVEVRFVAGDDADHAVRETRLEVQDRNVANIGCD